MALTARNIREFVSYLSHCTDAQVESVYYKETRAGRGDYAELAQQEALRRGFSARED